MQEVRKILCTRSYASGTAVEYHVRRIDRCEVGAKCYVAFLQEKAFTECFNWPASRIILQAVAKENHVPEICAHGCAAGMKIHESRGACCGDGIEIFFFCCFKRRFPA